MLKITHMNTHIHKFRFLQNWVTEIIVHREKWPAYSLEPNYVENDWQSRKKMIHRRRSKLKTGIIKRSFLRCVVPSEISLTKRVTQNIINTFLLLLIKIRCILRLSQIRFSITDRNKTKDTQSHRGTFIHGVVEMIDGTDNKRFPQSFQLPKKLSMSTCLEQFESTVSENKSLNIDEITIRIELLGVFWPIL